MVAGVWLSLPSIVRLDIPMQPYGGGGEFWVETHETQIAWGNGTAMAGVTYVQRRVGTAYYKSHPFETGEAVLDHLGGWLLTHGWTGDGPYPSSSALPEARFLAPEQMRSYYRIGDRDQRAHIAAFPIGGSIRGFYVVVATEQPSFWQKLAQGLD